MADATLSPRPPYTPPRPFFGLLAFLCSAIALFLVVLQMPVGPLAPQQSAGVTIGEIAAEIRDVAKRRLAGEPSAISAPQARPWDIDRLMKLAAVVLAGVGTALAAIALFQGEPRLLAGLAIGACATAILLQFLIWLALLAGGIILLVAIVTNLDSILGG
jgi:hypothetical protein